MSDKLLFQQIRKLVRQQKQKNTLDSHGDNFAREYCRIQMLKKKQMKPRSGNKMNHLIKNFQGVESYINIMDIIRNLPIEHQQQLRESNQQQKEKIPQILPKSIQMKMKQKLGPILNLKYEQESIKRKHQIEALQTEIDIGNNMTYQGSDIIRAMEATMNGDADNDKLELIDVLRKDIKLKQVYFIEKRFDDQIKDIGKVPTKIQNTKIFHKICSYLHMILQQEHRQKWASHQDKKLREARRQASKVFRISRTAKNSPDEKQKMTKTSQSRFYSPMRILDKMKVPQLVSSFSQTQNFFENNHGNEGFQTIKQDKQNKETFHETIKKNQSRKDILKQNFTFRRRNIKANLMSKINQFVDNVNDQEKKNFQVSKKYAKALQSLSEESKSSWSRFQRQQIAQTQDIQQMKKYLDNTLSRNRKDLKKFHRK